MKIVFDTNVLLSAFATHGLSYRVLDICLDKHKIFISQWIIDEISEKLKDKFNVAKNDILKVHQFIESDFKIVIPIGNLPEACRDADDNNILHLADFCNAEIIITGDKDLLVLHEHNQVKIINPRTFIEEYN
ncbi:MAG: putative toxin-antitoxin system toxin component, PIN family [Leptospirales bacterium]